MNIRETALGGPDNLFDEDDHSGEKYTYEVKIWDAENFKSWPGVKVPLRVLRIQETRLCGSQKEKGEQITTHMVTTADKVTLPTESAWRILHRRWDIENKVFHDLKTNWGFGHNHHHDKVAFMAMRWLIVITRNLFFLFITCIPGILYLCSLKTL